MGGLWAGYGSEAKIMTTAREGQAVSMAPRPRVALHCLAWLASSDAARGAVVVPHAFGGVALFARVLVGHLPNDTALLILQSHGLSGGELDTTLPSMANRYVLELRAADPPRPVIALGFCMGYMLAVAMAAQSPDLFDDIVLIDPGLDDPTGDDHVTAFAFEQIPEQYRPAWLVFKEADRDGRISMLAEAFSRKGIGTDAATEMVTTMYRVWEANAACKPLGDIDVIPESVDIVLVTDDATGVRSRLSWTRPVEVVPMAPRRGDRFVDLDLPALAGVVRRLLDR